jgi:long-chain acyl-CoA synthetase
LADIHTLVDIYRLALSGERTRAPFRTKMEGAYGDVSSRDFADAAREIAYGLLSHGLEPGSRVAILSETRIEWALADCAILSAGLAVVPVYPTLGSQTVTHILEDSGARALFVSSMELAAKAAGHRTAAPGTVVVVFQGGGGAGTLTLEDLRERGRMLAASDPGLLERRSAAVRPGDLATLIYTSGTTGTPKGVRLTHGNIASNVVASLRYIPLKAEDTALSFLPLSHIFERMAGLYAVLAAGATIAYAESIDAVPRNLQEVRPTVVMSVPRIYEKIYARAVDTARQGGPLKRAIFHWARDVGRAWSERVLSGRSAGMWLGLRHRMADALVFRKIRARTGGRIRFFVSGGAPLDRDIALFFHAAGLPILEGYGLTETSPVIAVNSLEHLRPGTVGKPLPEVEVRIAPDGEILARGPGIMEGYHNLPEATAEALQDGWFHTGDIGHLDPDGFLVITDRKKDLIVTAGGKKVPPQPIESHLKSDKFLSEAVVLGDRRPYLVALIVPEFNALEEYARFKAIPFADRSALVRDPHIRDLLWRRVQQLQAGRASFESIKRIHVLERELSVGEELTPTLKVKRKALEQKYAREIEAMYAENGREREPRSA